MTDRELLLEQLERLAIVLDELMPQCAELVRNAIALLKEQEDEIAKFCGEVARLTALLEEHEEREKRICKGICDFIHGCCCTDTDADKDYVCDVIQQCFIHGGR